VARWVKILSTSPSGKTQFICKFCGRTTPLPDKVCPSLPYQPAHFPQTPSCSELEAHELQKLVNPLLLERVLPLSELSGQVLKLGRRRNTQPKVFLLLKQQREVLLDAVRNAVFTALEDNTLTQRMVWDKLDDLKRELP